MASTSQSNSRSHTKKSKRAKESKHTSDEGLLHSSPKKTKFDDSKIQDCTIAQKSTLTTTTTTTTTNQNATLGWETEDLNTLINNLAKCLPKNDVAKFSTLVEKLDWEKVRFGGYSAQECKDKWFQVMSRLRRYRTLTDMVSDARVWLRAPWQTYNNAKKIKHPDLPKKPLTPFFRYFMEKREKFGKSNPGLSVTDLAKLLSSKFAALNERKKQKYKDSYDREYEEYKDKLEQFKIDHPEVEFGSMNKTQSAHGHAQEGPLRPRTPQQLFMEEKLKKLAPNNEGKKEALERIKAMWAQLSEGKRIKWIRRSLQDEQRYEAEVLEYVKEHPSFEPNKSKSVLTKAEKELKDKFDGKPERPPNSGYSLFSKILLRELKNVPSKEKMVVIAKRWKELSEQERQGYNREAQKAMTKYVEKFEAYLNSLPESERAKVLSENKLKLPSEKKLKQQQNLPKLQVPLQPEPAVEEDPRAKETAALMCYQMERATALQQKYPNKSKADILKITFQEWNEKLSEKKKAKYYKLSDSFASFVPSTSKTTQQNVALSPSKSVNSKDKKPTLASNSFMKREPKRPPKSGYALYTSEQLSSLTDFEPKKRMTEIARKWNHEISKTEKENYDSRAKELALHYQRDFAQFMATLSPEELEQYHILQSEKAKPKGKGRSNKSSKAEMDPVVDDSNVIETIDVSTSGNAVNSSDESNSESDNSDNEDGQQPQQQQTQQSSDSEESESESEDEDGSDSENSDSSY